MTELSVLFVDVRGFTSMSERLPPTEMVRRLNRFYELSTRVVVDLDGTLDKMVGDQVMAFFGRALSGGRPRNTRDTSRPFHSSRSRGNGHR